MNKEAKVKHFAHTSFNNNYLFVLDLKCRLKKINFFNYLNEKLVQRFYK